MEIFKLWRFLVSRRVMIYKVQDKHYFIGGKLFRECKANEAELYAQLGQELSFLRSVYKDLSILTKNDVKKLVEFYQKIVEICEHIEWSNDLENDGKPLCELLATFSEETVCDMEKQIIDYTTIHNLYEGCFYRESDVYKQERKINR